jgi:hypothetical protein
VRWEGGSRLWVEQYLCVHAEWSPAAIGPLREIAVEMVADADPGLNVVKVDLGGAVTSATWAFPEDDRSVSIVAEAVRPAVPRGVEHVAAGLATCFERLRARQVSRAELDGHVSDPHLGPVAASLPAVHAEPVVLVEVDVAS